MPYGMQTYLAFLLPPIAYASLEVIHIQFLGLSLVTHHPLKCHSSTRHYF
ncbi:MAG: hypothetical protein FWF70_06310 [Bacteroidetes bacterium]|nr:hypothetical protein [Bacteroidota bacterium]MCL1969392.1 hypothetical protein [Bacteroidota bacterium]